MTDSYRKWLEQLSPDDRTRLEEARKKPRPELDHLNQLYKKVDDGTATPEELAEYDERMRPYREQREEYGHGKFYDDRG